MIRKSLTLGNGAVQFTLHPRNELLRLGDLESCKSLARQLVEMQHPGLAMALGSPESADDEELVRILAEALHNRTIVVTRRRSRRLMSYPQAVDLSDWVESSREDPIAAPEFLELALDPKQSGVTTQFQLSGPSGDVEGDLNQVVTTHGPFERGAEVHVLIRALRLDPRPRIRFDAADNSPSETNQARDLVHGAERERVGLQPRHEAANPGASDVKVAVHRSQVEEIEGVITLEVAGFPNAEGHAKHGQKVAQVLPSAQAHAHLAGIRLPPRPRLSAGDEGTTP